MIENRGSKFSKIRVDLDNQSYKDCTFDECEIVYSAKGRVSLDGCKFNNCRYRFDGAAGNTIKMLAALYMFAPELIERTFDGIRGKSGDLPQDDGTQWVKAV
jgi:hypothetical protein